MKKSREEIEKAILSALDQKPLSIQQISEKISSNWMTVSEVLEELKKKGAVREIISTAKIKFYQKITDTYFNLPMPERQRKEFRYLFSKIIEEYKNQKKKIPNKTELAKAVVKVIEHPSLKMELPTVWYLYGKIPLMISDPSFDYSTDYVPENVNAVNKRIKQVVASQIDKKAWQLKLDQYSKHNQILYEIKEMLIYKKKWDKGCLELFNKFLINCPIKSNMSELFLLTEKFVGIVNKLSLISDIEKHRMDIIIVFESLWRYTAACLLFDSLTQIRDYSNSKEILKFYLEKPLEVRKECAEESISNLTSIYLSELTDKEIQLTKEESELREIMEDWTGD